MDQDWWVYVSKLDAQFCFLLTCLLFRWSSHPYQADRQQCRASSGLLRVLTEETIAVRCGFSTLLTTYTGFVIPVVHGELHGELKARWCSFLLLIEIVFAELTPERLAGSVLLGVSPHFGKTLYKYLQAR